MVKYIPSPTLSYFTLNISKQTLRDLEDWRVSIHAIVPERVKPQWIDPMLKSRPMHNSCTIMCAKAQILDLCQGELGISKQQLLEYLLGAANSFGNLSPSLLPPFPRPRQTPFLSQKASRSYPRTTLTCCMLIDVKMLLFCLSHRHKKIHVYTTDGDIN